MISKTSRLLFSLIIILMTIAILPSCDKDDEENSGSIELLSFGPTGAKHGDTLKFIGHNLNNVSAIQFTGGAEATVEQKDFKEQTSELIKVIVPQAAEKGYVILKTTQGDIVTKTQFNLDVATTVTSMTLQARPGTNVTINGTYLNWVQRITFARDKVVQTFVSKSFDQIVVTVPPDAETGPLVLFYSGTDSSDVQTDDTLKVTLPITTSLAPVPVKPQTNLTITGTDLDLAKKVIFNGVSTPVTTFVSQSATQLVVKVPETAKKGKLILEAASGVQTTSGSDLEIVLPVITAFSPSPINLGANLTITGTDLDLVKKVIFSGVAVPVAVFSTQTLTELVLAVPAGSRDGKIKLEAASGVHTTSTDNLDVILPAVTSMSPNPVFPATNLTITGTQLDMVTSIGFENAPSVSSFVSQTASQIVVTVPNGVLSGKITLGITNPADTVQSLESLGISGGVPPPTIAFPIYNDAVTANWNGWVGDGWGGTKDLANTSPVREGTKSVRINYVGQWGVPFQLGGANISLAGYTTLKVSIYGGAGTNGKSVNIGFNEVDGKTVTIVEGQWTDFAIPLSQISSVTTLKFLYIKNYSPPGDYTIYIDALGLN